MIITSPYMEFSFYYPLGSHDSTFDDDMIILINGTSHFVRLSNTGIYRSNTGHAQPGIDYDRTGACYRPRVIGVDII